MHRAAVLFLVAGNLALASAPASAFNPVAHLEIAEQAFSQCGHTVELRYGAIAPDLASFVEDSASWPSAFEDTHYSFADLRDDAVGTREQCFAAGWLAHSESVGADYYAPVEYPSESFEGYVERKARQLSAATGLDLGFAHYAVEVAVDLLVDAERPAQSWKLLLANALRSWRDFELLSRVLVAQEGRTDWWTLLSSELAFRALVHQYASALVLPAPFDRVALAQLGVELASAQFQIDVTSEEVGWLLEVAVALCAHDYRAALDEIAHRVAAAVI